MNYISEFKINIQQNADKPALIDFDGTRQTTYAELDRLSSRVAGKLHALGCSKGDFIPILIERRMEYVAAYLGILKAGCVVVPLIPEYPKERISYIAEHCEAKLTIDIKFFEDIEAYEAFEDLAGDDEPALMIYTSGSTGTPKGILHTVSSVVHSLKRMNPLLTGLDSVVLAATIPLSFIVHVQEYLLTFLFGGIIHILTDKQRTSPQLLIQYYEKYAITCGFIPAQMLKYIPSLPKTFKRIFTGGERLTTVADSLDTDIYYLYGQGETCSGVTLNTITAEHRTFTLGKALDGIEISILDDNGTVVKYGLEGEICVKGDFSVEYFKSPEATSKTFIKTDDGKTLVHTGDVGYIDENGNLIYVNRKDWMVKINGQRVET
ncbi:MAG TPA: AMP-binding protein, partial [Methanocorpusculum sp.]|nr:AMP-binding protein [Methanocorpusculum sp.]